ncbi:MAG: PEP-utilizing enzyme [Candidatus Gracilibacteria bacterium]|jgi:phosphohistidine swiveling domain-containing protein
MKTNKYSFCFDKVSGMEGSVFGLSVIPDVVKASDSRHLFKFKRYALLVDAQNHRADEFLDIEWCKSETERILEFVDRNGMSYFQDTANDMSDELAKLTQLSKGLYENISGISDYDLVQKFNDFAFHYSYSYGLGSITFVYESILSEIFQNLVSVEHPEVPNIVNELLVLNHKSFILESESILKKIKTASDNIERSKLVEDYKSRFFFIKANYYDADILNDVTVLKMADEYDNNSGVVRNEDAGVKRAVELPVLSKKLKLVVELLKITAVIRDERKKLNLIGSYTLFRFISELVKRKGVERDIAKRAFWFEFADLVFDTQATIKKLSDRKVVSLVMYDNSFYYLDYDAIESQKTIATRSVFKGTPASKGKVRGSAKVVIGREDFDKFGDGDILVTEMTRPEFVSLMKLASAIVTNEGGIMSHAAIVARELNKPCVVGARGVIPEIQDGDLVEIDADKGVVKILKRSVK